MSCLQTNKLRSVFVCSTNMGKVQEFRSALSKEFEVLGVRELEQEFGVSYDPPEENSDSFLVNALIKLGSAVQFLERCAEGKNLRLEQIASFVLVDDSGLCVPFLDFLPGVHSATFGGEPRCDEKNRKKLREVLASSSKNRTEAFFVCFLFLLELGKPNLKKYFKSLDINDSLEEIYRYEKETFLKKAQDACCNSQAIFSTQSVFFRDIKNKISFCLNDGILDNVSFSYYLKETLYLFFGSCSGFVDQEEQNLLPGSGHGYDSMFYGRNNPKLSFASITLDEKNKTSHRGAALKELKDMFEKC